MSTKGNFLENSLTPEQVTQDGRETGIKAMRITAYHSTAAEMAGITTEVIQLLEQNVDPGKIAIIYAQDGCLKSLEQSFNLKRIPFFCKREVNILTEIFIQKLIYILRYISMEHASAFSGDYLLFEILHFDFFNVPAIEIAKLVAEVNSKKRSASPTTMRKLLLEKAGAPPKDLFDTGVNKELKKAGLIFEKLIEDAAGNSLPLLFEHTIRDLLLPAYIEKNDDSRWLEQLQMALDNLIKSETVQAPHLTLIELLDVIETKKKEGMSGMVTREKGAPGGIQVTDLKNAGISGYDYLFIAGSTTALNEKEDWFNGILQHFDPDVSSMPVTAGTIKEKSLDLSLFESLSDGENLFISYVECNGNGKQQKPVLFMPEIISRYARPVHDIQMREVELPEYGLSKISSRPQIENSDERIVAPALEKSIMSVSALNNYLGCPLGFYYKNILRVPAGKNEPMAFGSAIHFALEKLFKNMSAGYRLPGLAAPNNHFVPAEEMIADFRNYMERHRTNFTATAFYRRMKYGEDVLLNYYNHYINSWTNIVSVERNISGVTINGVPIKGKPDKLEFNGKEVIIVDYKSGSIEKALPKMQPPGDENPNGGDYWRQAVFYKILVDNYAQKGWKVTSVEFDFIEPDKNKDYRKVKISINLPAIETVKQQITAVWAKIQARDFYTGCGLPDCHWCNFVKNNNLAVALHVRPQVAAVD